MKRLLALDGGGIRGVFSLKILQRIERQLREKTGNPDLVLGDWFDYVGGTSTGAIIATMIAWGLPADDILRLYKENSTEMFRKTAWHQRLKSKFHSEGLTEFFKGLFREPDTGELAKLGTDQLRCKLLIVTRNASTGAPWPITSNPDAKYNAKGMPGCNLELPIWQLLRASTAAPTFFPPEVVTIYGEEGDYVNGVECTFEDGGITPYNNPAYLLYLKASLPEYRTAWPTGEDQMSLISIGTGMEKTGRGQKVEQALWEVASSLPSSLIGSFQRYQDFLCRTTGHCRFGAPIDSEVGDLIRPSEDAKFGYVRYDYTFEQSDIDACLRLSKAGLSLDNIELIPFLEECGQKYADGSVRIADYAPEL